MGESLRNGLKWLLSILIVSQVQAFYIPGKLNLGAQSMLTRPLQVCDV